jgi:hypothetical protein
VARRTTRGGALPHAHYGVDLSKVPDTYIEPFVAYRAWNWTAEGVQSLNHAPWTPKEAFEAQCNYRNDWKSMMAACSNEAAEAFWKTKEHHVPSADCTCGMYAGINMQHLIDIGYIQHGIHGEVSLWGRLERNTLGWRAQFAYPKYFVVPVNMVPLDMTEAKCRLDSLTEFDVDIYLQPDTEVTLKSEKIPLWMPDYGYTTQGLTWLVEKRAKWYAEKVDPVLKVGDRVAVYGTTSGIGIVKEIVGDDMLYTMFAPDKIYRKPVKSVKWDRHNWRWETTGVGSVRGI